MLDEKSQKTCSMVLSLVHRILRSGLGFVGLLFLILGMANLLQPLGEAANSNPTRAGSINSSLAAKLDASGEPPPVKSWYFAVSGDSRECGDVIMPKIAASIAANAHQSPVKF
jgi:hypothetical protein